MIRYQFKSYSLNLLPFGRVARFEQGDCFSILPGDLTAGRARDLLRINQRIAISIKSILLLRAFTPVVDISQNFVTGCTLVWTNNGNRITNVHSKPGFISEFSGGVTTCVLDVVNVLTVAQIEFILLIQDGLRSTKP